MTPTVDGMLPLFWAYRNTRGTAKSKSLQRALGRAEVDGPTIRGAVVDARSQGDTIGALLGGLLLQMGADDRKEIARRFYETKGAKKGEEE